MMRKIPGLFILVCVCLAAFLNTGTVRRKQTAVLKTQTKGIKLQDKLEELKDGEKGPATPSFGWYGGKNSFMSEPPFSKDDPANTGAPPAALPPVSEVDLPQSEAAPTEGGAKGQKNDENWDEDWAADGTKEDEALPAKADTEEVVDQPGPTTTPPPVVQGADTSKDKKASKWDKDWWDEI